MQSTTIGVDLAKTVFQLSLSDQTGKVFKRHRMSRGQFERFLVKQEAAHVVMEACGTSNHWARFSQAQGHQVSLLHPNYVKPYVRRNKTDAADADALIQAIRDPEIKPVPVKSVDHQALQGLHRVRQQLIDTKRKRINLVRSLLAELGISLPRGTKDLCTRLRAHLDQVPGVLAATLDRIVDEIGVLIKEIMLIDKQLEVIAKEHAVAKQLMTIPGIGVTTATAIVASVPNIHQFNRARQFSAWLGLTPREYSSGNNRYLGRISKKGDKYLRMLLVHGARSALQGANRKRRNGKELTKLERWATDIERAKHHNIATVALANKMARIIWATWTKGEDYIAR
jgi:transposase